MIIDQAGLKASLQVYAPGETTGQALLTTSIVLSLGFGVFLLASMPTLQVFGMITVLEMYMVRAIEEQLRAEARR